MTTFDEKASSRDEAAPVNLYTFRGSEHAELQLEHLIRSVNIIPGTTEFGYGTTPVRKGLLAGENVHAGGDTTDFTRSIDQLMERVPNLVHVNLIVAWHGDDLRIGECLIKPRIETRDKETTPYSWQVGPVTRENAEVVSQIDGKPAIGGAPSDRSVYEAIVYLKSRDLEVTVVPFIIMDIPADNNLPDPYGGTKQAAYPWRGRITCHPAPGQPGSPDGTQTASPQIESFFGTVSASDFGWDASSLTVAYTGVADEWSFRRHILHIARIAQAADADDFLIGSEMVGITRLRQSPATFTGVTQFTSLADEARTILGAEVKICYAADWSEYGSYQYSDTSIGSLIVFPLDVIWAHDNIDYVAIDNYLPISDWRTGKDHHDARAGYPSGYDLDYLRNNVQAGEYYDWYYASQEDRDNQVRTPITDGAYNKPWVFRAKDIVNWWSNRHFIRVNADENGFNTSWIPKSKKIVFTEIGCPAISRGANQPGVFTDAKSSENAIPYYSLGIRDDHAQRAFLEASLSYWQANNPASDVYDGNMLDLDRVSVYAWDARPYPDFPDDENLWGDAPNWELGHWLNGRLRKPTPLSGQSGVFRYTDAEREIEYGGFTYTPVPIRPSKLKTEGNLPRNDVRFGLPRNSPLAEIFKGFRPAYPLTLTILQGHHTDESGLFLPRWSGRITSSKRKGEVIELTGVPHTIALARTGLTRNYEIGCPHDLYGPLCRANLANATTSSTVTSIAGPRVTVAPGWNTQDTEKYVTGFVEWTRDNGQVERRSILRVEDDVITLSGAATGLAVDDDLSIILGCNRTVNDCRDIHDNIDNCGACPTIPVKNPFSGNTNNFY